MRPVVSPVFVLWAVVSFSGCGGPGVTPGFSNVSTQTCPSGQQWTAGNAETGLMQPGLDCNACHERLREGPIFSIAGTVYANTDETDGCIGVEGPQVVITGADGRVLTLLTNAAGNFSSRASVALPFTAKVVSGAGTREMTGAQTDGSCNSCHTPTGLKSAPGRIMAP